MMIIKNKVFFSLEHIPIVFSYIKSNDVNGVKLYGFLWMFRNSLSLSSEQQHAGDQNNFRETCRSIFDSETVIVVVKAFVQF
jgi:hypothetical protein